MKLSPQLRPSGLSSELDSRGSQLLVSLPSTRTTYLHHPVPPVRFPQSPLLPGVFVSRSHCLVPLLFRPLLLSLRLIPYGLQHLFDNLITAGETNASQFSANVIAGRCVIMTSSSSSSSSFPTSISPKSCKCTVRIRHFAAPSVSLPEPHGPRPVSSWRCLVASYASGVVWSNCPPPPQMFPSRALGNGHWPLAAGIRSIHLSTYPPPSDIRASTVHNPIFSASFPPKRPESD